MEQNLRRRHGKNCIAALVSLWVSLTFSPDIATRRPMCEAPPIWPGAIDRAPGEET
jgi:hypothetical protein